MVLFLKGSFQLFFFVCLFVFFPAVLLKTTIRWYGRKQGVWLGISCGHPAEVEVSVARVVTERQERFWTCLEGRAHSIYRCGCEEEVSVLQACYLSYRVETVSLESPRRLWDNYTRTHG
jgi:hypothetical protein